jgi:hypothetical protein
MKKRLSEKKGANSLKFPYQNLIVKISKDHSF